LGHTGASLKAAARGIVSDCVPTRRRLLLSGALALFFATVTLLGASFRAHGSAEPLFATGAATASAILRLVALWVAYTLLVLLAVGLLNHQPKGGDSLGRLPDRRFKLIAFLVVMLCYAPYLCILYPGNVPYDGYWQLNVFTGVWPWENWHPVLSTMLMGGVFSLGRALIDDNFGIFLYVSLQSLCMAYTFASCCLRVYRLKLACLAWAAVGFFALCPVWPTYAVTFEKDGLYLIIFVWLSMLVLDRLTASDAPAPKEGVKLAAAAALLCLARHNGIHIVLPTLAALMPASSKGARTQVGAALAVAALAYVAVNMVAVPCLGITPAGANEMMSIPYQQTARVVFSHPEEITAEQREVISTVIDYDRIPELYDPEISDEIKMSLHHIGSPTGEYLRLWAAMSLQHPTTYFSATFHNTYGYYYLYANFDVLPSFPHYIMGYPVAYGDLDIHYAHKQGPVDKSGSYSLPKSAIERGFMPSQDAPEAITRYITAWRQTPLLDLTTRPGA
jgi:hypothetical protein